MTPVDVDRATSLLVAGDFGDRRTWFEFVTTQPECRPLVAELEGVIVGTGVGAAHGTVGWVGTVYVAPDRRRGGLGRALTQAVIDRLEDLGCRTLLLVATSEGLPLYERMGFEVQTRYRILEAPGVEGGRGAEPMAGVAGPGPMVRPFAAADLPVVASLDAAATGEDRAHVLRRFATPDSAKVLVGPESAVRGFVVRAPWGGGATIAADQDDAMRILEARRVAAGPGGRVRVGVVEENEAGLTRLEQAGLTPIWSAPRMIRGEALTWHPDWIWGQFNHAIG
jgi:GNAT superfamily N-acetyltransferase